MEASPVSAHGRCLQLHEALEAAFHHLVQQDPPALWHAICRALQVRVGGVRRQRLAHHGLLHRPQPCARRPGRGSQGLPFLRIRRGGRRQCRCPRRPVLGAYREVGKCGRRTSYRTVWHRIGPAPIGAFIAPTAFAEVLRQKGHLPLATVLRCRVRYFTDSAVLGSQAFVAFHLAAYRCRNGARQRTAPRPLLPITDFGAASPSFAPNPKAPSGMSSSEFFRTPGTVAFT